MKTLILSAVLSVIVFSGIPVLAQSAEAADKGFQTEQVTANVQKFDKQMAQSQEYIKKMQQQMNSIHQAQDPKQRQKLLKEHWSTMQRNMQLMHNMWGPDGVMGCCMRGSKRGAGMMRGWRHMGGHYAEFTPEQLQQRQYMMDQYLPMQQMMMHHMMQHQHYMWAK